MTEDNIKIYWLSFIDTAKPIGFQFLGVCIIKAPNAPAAHEFSIIHRCNPGGEVKIFTLNEKCDIPEKYFNRLLTKEEAHLADKDNSND